jgi:phytoene/squalene synthetase
MELDKSYRYCKSLNHIGMEYPLLAASVLPDEKKNSIAACLASFRCIINKVHESLGDRSLCELDKEKANFWINEWEGMVEEARNGKCRDEMVCPALADTMVKFRIPVDPWSAFKNALNFHLRNCNIPDEKTFRSYCRWTYGASLYTYVHIIASKRDGDEYVLNFDPGFISDDLACLFFIVHTLTDIPSDLTSTKDGFIFIPQTMLDKYAITSVDLQEYMDTGEIDDRFRKVIDEFYHFGRQYERYSREKLVLIREDMEIEEWFLLDLLLNIYSRFLNRIWEYPEAVFSGGYPIDPAMVFINAMKLQKDLGLKFPQDLSKLLLQNVA